MATNHKEYFHFPVSSSILSAKALKKFLYKKYNFSENVDCQLIKAGVNHSYFVNDNDLKYIFRIYSFDWRSKSEILEEISFLNHLKEKHISVSFPISDKQGNYLQCLNAPEGERLGVLFSYAEGEKIATFSKELHFEAGVFLAKLHQITLEMQLKRVDYNAQNLLMDSFENVKEFLPKNTEEMLFMTALQTFLIKELSEIKENEIRKGVVHLDIWFDNMNISQENKITLFDFDFCGNGWLCLDIAYYVMQIHNLEKEENELHLKINHFLAGYESVTKISKEEKRILPILGASLYFFYLGVQCKRFEDWSNVFLNQNYLKRYITIFVKRFVELNKIAYI